jgi:fructuronate reductase
VRLSAATLDRLPAGIARPGYDRAAITRGVVHLGLGAFTRAHQALVFERALAAGDRRWGITGASLRSPAVRDALAPQDGLYTLVTRDGDGDRRQVIGAVQDVLVAPEDPAALVGRLAEPATHLVTLTITEKGYRLGPDGALASGEADVAADLASLDRPRTAPGFLVAALARRRVAGLAPFTAISCDNLPGNGRRLAAAIAELAAAHDPALARWIEAEAAFPETMVDRIVPATTDEDIAAFAAATGVEDSALVKAEPFLQWVVEDRFCSPRPDLAAFGVQLTDAVAPWEEAKLRLLNGAHSALAYLGALAGLTFVHEAVARPEWRRLVETLWDESAATLSPPPGLDLSAYRAQLMARFANPALAHRLRQIAGDGSQKLPQRLLAPLRARKARGLASPALSLAVAGWMRWQGGRLDTGEAIAVDDPLAETLARAQAGATDTPGRAAALLAAIAPGEPLPAGVVAALAGLERGGAAAAVAALG